MKKRVILFSNGLDSVVLKAWVERNVHESGDILIPVYFNYNSELFEAERARMPNGTRFIHCDFTEGIMHEWPKKSNCEHLGQTWIPGRNLTLMAMAVSRFLPDEIYYGVTVKENISNYADKNDEFVRLAENVLSRVSYKPVKIHRPFVNLKLDKPRLITLGKSMGIVNEMRNSISCMNVIQNPCGKCHKCISRHLAFKANGLDDYFYSYDILQTEEAKNIISKSPRLQELQDYVNSGNILVL